VVVGRDSRRTLQRFGLRVDDPEGRGVAGNLHLELLEVRQVARRDLGRQLLRRQLLGADLLPDPAPLELLGASQTSDGLFCTSLTACSPTTPSNRTPTPLGPSSSSTIGFRRADRSV
jgi:hypothetical protein